MNVKKKSSISFLLAVLVLYFVLLEFSIFIWKICHKKIRLNGSAGWLFRLEETLDNLFAKGNYTVMVLLDYSLGRENLETLLPFMVFNVERALENWTWTFVVANSPIFLDQEKKIETRMRLYELWKAIKRDLKT
jgi:hypothetical protein